MHHMHQWAITVHHDQLQHCGHLRHAPAVQCLHIEDVYWIIGPLSNGLIPTNILSIPLQDIYMTSPQQDIYHLESAVCCGKLPEGSWENIAETLRIVPQMSYPGISPPETKAQVTIVSSDEFQNAEYLLLNRHHFLHWLDTVPALRLESLKYCIISDNSVLIYGQPLPTCLGDRFYQIDGIIIPSGSTWSPAINAHILRKWIGLQDKDQAININDAWYYIRQEVWKPITRHDGRYTMRKLEHA